MKKFVFFAALALVFLFNVPAYAALSMDAYIGGTNVTGSVYDVDLNDSIQLDLYISSDDPLVNGGFQIAYNTSLIDVTNVTYNAPPWFFALTNTWEGGLIDLSVQGPPGGSVDATDSLFASIYLTCLAPGLDTWSLLATADDRFVTDLGDVLDGDIDGMLLVGVNQVPIPGAVWLLGSGLIGILGIRRRRNR